LTPILSQLQDGYHIARGDSLGSEMKGRAKPTMQKKVHAYNRDAVVVPISKHVFNVGDEVDVLVPDLDTVIIKRRK